jgi:oligopeptide/dipeptide ABC transporter ATP-binding protein
MSEALVEIRNLRTHFRTEGGVTPAVDGVSLRIECGQTLCVVGESGCGKSVTALSVMRLIPEPPGRIVDGEILFAGRDLLKLSTAEMRKIRGSDIAMIFQEPMTSLNPIYSIGDQIAETIAEHQGKSRSDCTDRVVELLRLVGIPLPERRAKEYPHQFSGGMRQRAMIAMALSCNPKLLIADEPTTALDVTIQAQILDLMRRLKQELNMAIMLITHDLGVVAEMATRVAVLYAGKVVEESDVLSLFRQPLHPYTEGLLRSVPRLDAAGETLHVVKGLVPNPMRLPPGCRFHPRCPHAIDRCRREQPALEQVAPGRHVACFLGTERLAAGGAVQ